MCLYPKLIRNRKYQPNKKNGNSPPSIKDKRTMWTPVGCGNCIECRKQIAQEWRVRLHEEIKEHKYKYFVTLTFSPEALKKLCDDYNIEVCNGIATKAVRLFLERVRKQTKKSLKHWLITELGQEESERIHLHGIIFSEYEITNDWLNKMWQYGITDTGQYCNERTINYIIKYVYKIDTIHKNYKPVVLCSKGIGASYIQKGKSKHVWNAENTRDYYTLPNGQRVSLPIYYRNHFFTEEQREQLWIYKLNKDIRYIRGIPFRGILTNNHAYEKFIKVLKKQQDDNIAMGFGNDKAEWKKQEYNVTYKMLQKGTSTSAPMRS